MRILGLQTIMPIVLYNYLEVDYILLYYTRFQVLSNKSDNPSQPLRLINLVELTMNGSRSFSPLIMRSRRTVCKYAEYYIFYII